ncbi:sigma-54-dependent Fis family transcriptional regulator, partial [Candidatus Poribacteria bacterium]|nr:sigma-54-dependent Fis family transcriptional regulator [Candidatus Poribacteria bacterium]
MNIIVNDLQNHTPLILIADDEKNIRYSLKRMFGEKQYEVLEAKNGTEAIETIKKCTPDLILMDIQMGDSSGLDTLKEIKTINSKIPIIIMTAYGTTQTAIEAMKFGAFDYVLKPFDVSLIWKLVEDALNINRFMKSAISYNPKEYISGLDCIVGSSPTMQEIYKMIGRVAEKDITVLILGETGTGKELIARAIYHNSKRNSNPYIPINCAAIPDALLESELFGYEKGAFTDAHMRRIGKFEQCNGGTIFLDEIGDMSMNTQSKILRVLQEREI